MAAMKNLNVRVDEELKGKAERIFDELGMSMSTAIAMFLKSTVRCGGFPCELYLKPAFEEKLNLKATPDWNKEKAWNFTLEMMKADGLEPSVEFLKLIEREKRGEITTGDILKALDQKHTMKGNEDYK